MAKLLRVLTDRKMFIVFVMGFASGLPLLLTDSTLKIWLTELHVDLTTIGLFSLVGLPYTLKFLWAPFLDRYVPPLFGRRRGWMALTQAGLIVGFVILAFTNPEGNTWGVAAIAIFITLMSATQDISIDAYRREILPMEEFGFGNSLAITGYRLGMLLAGAGALAIAALLSWPATYLIMAGAVAFALVITITSPEPVFEHAPPRTLQEAFVGPFFEFFSRKGALWILAFILLYKVGDNMASAMTGPFYIQMHYSKIQIAGVVKVFGIWSTILGGIIGGTVMMYLGLNRSLWIFGILQAVSTLGFAWLASMVPAGDAGAAFTASAVGWASLAAVISVENLTAGMGTAAYTTFMAAMTNKKFTATQYALLSSLMGVPRVIISAPTGWIAQHTGWTTFFTLCALSAAPGLLLLFKIKKLNSDVSESLHDPANR